MDPLSIGLSVLSIFVALGWWLERAKCRRATAEVSRNSAEQESRRLAGCWVEEERRILELVATGAPLTEILDAVNLSMESQLGDCQTSVLLLDESRQHLRHGSAPSLPKAYCDAIDGVRIGPNVGSCGTAAYLDEMVIVEDIRTDPKWAPFVPLADAHGLRACWSFPIRDSRHHVIGTFALYHRTVAKPTESHVENAKAWARLAAVAIENHQTHESVALYAQRMEVAEQAANFGVWEADLLTGRLTVSPNFLTMIDPPDGLDLEDSRVWRQLVHPADFDAAFADLDYAIQNGTPWNSLCRLRRKDGTYRWVRSAARATCDAASRAMRLTGASIDVTVEKEMLLHLEEAKQAAENATRVKSQFLANMSHEIRTPLNGMIASVSLLSDMGIPDEQREYLDTIRASGESLLQVVNDILDFSKIEAGKILLESHPFSLEVVLDEVQAIMGSLARAKGFQFRIRHAPFASKFLGDSVRLRQILLNLSSNAIKFTMAGSVRIDVAAESGGLYRFTVTDTGIGMAPEVAASIFEPFTQADSSTTRRHGGTGLGLSITRRLLHLMGSEIHFRSTPGEGSVFEFTLALPRAPADAVAPLAEESSHSCDGSPVGNATRRRLKVLVAEDNSINQTVIRQLLRRLGHEPAVVPNGREAVSAALSGHYDLILMDCQMPEMDGLEATVRLRELGSSIYVIALTANAFEEDRKKCAACGMNDYLSKPIMLDSLDEALSRAASHWAAEEVHAGVRAPGAR